MLEDAEVHDHDAELDLQLRAAFGSGLRTNAALIGLFSATGYRPGGEEGQDIGW